MCMAKGEYEIKKKSCRASSHVSFFSGTQLCRGLVGAVWQYKKENYNQCALIKSCLLTAISMINRYCVSKATQRVFYSIGYDS